MCGIIQFKNVSKSYSTGEHNLLVLDNVSFTINKGEFVIILGPSGAGKSTVLNLLGGMDYASSGEIVVDGKNIVGYNDDKLTEYRATTIGFVFQFYNLIPTLTVLENVALTKSIVKNPFDAREILTSVELGDHLDQFPSQLSGGEQQRVAIARAIAKNPSLLLCDEPTGALDSETCIVILSLLQQLCREKNKTVIIVTHNASLAQAADKVIKIKNGKIKDVILNESPVGVSEVNW
jgi:putative ABC transport system ATP-binding protein